MPTNCCGFAWKQEKVKGLQACAANEAQAKKDAIAKELEEEKKINAEIAKKVAEKKAAAKAEEEAAKAAEEGTQETSEEAPATETEEAPAEA